jgi:hypothetical protein
MALPIVLENEGNFFEPKKRIMNTKIIMNHSAPAIFISIDEKTNYDLPSRINDAILPYLDNPIFVSKESVLEKRNQSTWYKRILLKAIAFF